MIEWFQAWSNALSAVAWAGIFAGVFGVAAAFVKSLLTEEEEG
jgi:hypothetical protein